jgi:hypothetical protein
MALPRISLKLAAVTASLTMTSAVTALAGPAASGAAAATMRRAPALMPGLHLVPVGAAATPAGPYIIVNGAHSLCLDAARSHDGTNGDKVQLWTCNSNDQQRWFLGSNKSIVNGAHGLCLDAARSHDGTNGDKVQLWTCNGNDQQRWSGVQGTFKIVNGAHGLCLDAARSHDGTNGDQVQLWTCNGNAQQNWGLAHPRVSPPLEPAGR